MSQIYNDNTQRPKPKENGILGTSSREFRHSVGNSADGFGSRKEHCRDYVSIFENTPKNLQHLTLNVAATLLSGSGKGAVGA